MDAEKVRALIAREIDGCYCLPGVNEVATAVSAADKVLEALHAGGYQIIQFKVVDRAPLIFDVETPPFG